MRRDDRKKERIKRRRDSVDDRVRGSRIYSLNRNRLGRLHCQSSFSPRRHKISLLPPLFPAASLCARSRAFDDPSTDIRAIVNYVCFARRGESIANASAPISSSRRIFSFRRAHLRVRSLRRLPHLAFLSSPCARLRVFRSLLPSSPHRIPAPCTSGPPSRWWGPMHHCGACADLAISFVSIGSNVGTRVLLKN